MAVQLSAWRPSCSAGDSYCSMMEPMKAQLCKELGCEIRCFEVWYDSRNLELLQLLDGGK